MPVQTQIQIRRGTASQWTTTNPVLAAGELGLETDTGYLKAGNGSSLWSSLSYINQYAQFPALVTNAQSGTSYTTVLSDAYKIIELNNSSAITLTVPLSSSVAYAIGTQIQLLQTGTGQVTVAATAGVTINYNPGLKLRGQWSSATLIKRGTDTWVLVGDITA
jgi:hypothetical protein